MSNGGEICVQAYGHTVERPRVVVFRMVGHHQGKPRLRWVRSEYPPRGWLDALLAGIALMVSIALRRAGGPR